MNKRVYGAGLAGFIALFLSSNACADVYMAVGGAVEIDRSCEKMSVSALRLIVSPESTLDNARSQVVPLGPDGRFSVQLVDSYNYIFQVLRTDDGSREILGSGRFEYLYQDKTPVITARCKPVEKKA